MKPIDLQASEFWNGNNRRVRETAHWRGAGRWRNDAQWLAIGARHFAIWQEMMELHPRKGPWSKLLEWGCGGGSNVVAFGRIFKWITGVDISPETLQRCAEQARMADVVFEPFPIAIDNPAACLELDFGSYDAFLCTAVIQHLPDEEYALRVLTIARYLTRKGGCGLVQFREPRDCRVRRSKSVYVKNVACWLLIKPEAFIEMCDRAGWRVLQYYGDREGRSGYMFVFLEAK